MITKGKLREVISEWIKPMCQECEGTGGCWYTHNNPNSSYVHLNNSSTKLYLTISTRLCYDHNKKHTGYIIYLNTDDEHPIIKIEGDDLVDCISDNNIYDFKKEHLYDLINRIKQAMGQDISEPKIHNDLPVILQQVERTILEWFHRQGDRDVEIEKTSDTNRFIRINWISKIIPIELRSSYNYNDEFVGYDIYGGKPISAHPFILMRSNNIYFNKIPQGFMLSPILERYMYEIFEMIRESAYINPIRKYRLIAEDLKKISESLNVPIITAIQKTNSKGENNTMKQPEIKKFFYSGHTTVVIWDDGTKTMSSPSGDEMFDPEMGLAMAVAKKYFGNRHKFEKIVADGLYGKYLDDYRKMFVNKWTKNLKKKNTDEKIQAYTQALNELIDVKKNIRNHIDEELKKHEVDKNEFKKKLDEYDEAVAAGKKPKRPVLKSHRTPEMRDLQVRLKAVKDLITFIEQHIKNLGG